MSNINVIKHDDKKEIMTAGMSQRSNEIKAEREKYYSS